MSSISSTQTLALLLSGGVDSAVALHLLCEQDIRPDCFYIRIGPEDKSDEPWDCSSEEDLEMATALCRRYGCRLEVVFWFNVLMALSIYALLFCCAPLIAM